MKKEIKFKGSKISAIAIALVSFIAFLIGFFEAGVGSLLVIPLLLIGYFGSILGVIPFIGPLLYYLGIGWIFNTVQNLFGIALPVSSAIIFYFFLAVSILYSIVSILLLTTALVLLAMIKKRIREKKYAEENQN